MNEHHLKEWAEGEKRAIYGTPMYDRGVAVIALVDELRELRQKDAVARARIAELEAASSFEEGAAWMRTEIITVISRIDVPSNEDPVAAWHAWAQANRGALNTAEELDQERAEERAEDGGDAQGSTSATPHAGSGRPEFSGARHDHVCSSSSGERAPLEGRGTSAGAQKAESTKGDSLDHHPLHLSANIMQVNRERETNEATAEPDGNDPAYLTFQAGHVCGMRDAGKMWSPADCDEAWRDLQNSEERWLTERRPDYPIPHCATCICGKRAPVQESRKSNKPLGTISWDEHVEVFGFYAARYGHAQTAERLAERGGFGYDEITLLTGQPPKTWVAVRPSPKRSDPRG